MPNGYYYSAEPDDCILSIAHQHGFYWKTIWNHPQNAELRKLRKDANSLLAGDSVFIPELRLRTEDGGTEAHHTFRRKGVPALARFRFLDKGKPRANVPYILRIGGRSFKGRTDAQGSIQAPMDPTATTGELILGERRSAEKYELWLGRLDPVGEISGALMRLESLGFDCGEGGDPEQGFVSALSSFQLSQGLDVTGQLDGPTQDALLKSYGC